MEKKYKFYLKFHKKWLGNALNGKLCWAVQAAEILGKGSEGCWVGINAELLAARRRSR